MTTAALAMLHPTRLWRAWSRRGAPPRWLGPLLAAVVAAGLVHRVGPQGAWTLALLAAAPLLALGSLLRFDLLYGAFLFYLLFETVLAPFLPPPFPLLSKDLFYAAVATAGLLIAAVTWRGRDRPSARGADQAGTCVAARSRPDPLLAAVLLFGLVGVLLAVRGPSPLLGVLGLRSVTWFCLVAVLAPLAFERPGARRAHMVLLAVGVTAVAIVGIYEFFHWRELRAALELEEQRWTMGTLKAGSTVGSPGAYGALMGLGLLFLVARAVEGGVPWWGWWVGIPTACVWFAGLVLSFSRISQIAFLCGVFLLLLRRVRLLLPGLVALLLAGVVANQLTDGFLWGNLQASIGRGDHFDAIESTHERVEIVQETLTQRIPQHPWLGFGLGAAGAPTRFRVEDAPFGYLFLDNYYLLMLLQGGVLGLAAYVGLLVALLLAGLGIHRACNVRPPPRLADAAAVRAAAAGIVFFAVIGTASTVHEMPVVNAAFWWCAGWLLWGRRFTASAAPTTPVPAT